MLLGKKDFVTIGQVASQLGQTNRTVQYDLQKINIMLENFNLPHIISRRNKGICILPEDKEKLKIFLRKKNFTFIFSAEERIAVIICENILSCRVKTVDEISNALQVSRNTCLNDIRSVKKKLRSYGITLKTNASKYSFSGNGIRMRSVLMYNISYLYPLIESGKLPYLQEKCTQENLKKLRSIESQLNITYRTGTLNKIAVMISRCEKPLKEKVSFFEGVDLGEKILSLVDRYFNQYSENDRRYITVQLMGSRIRSGEVNETTGRGFEYYRTCAEHLVEYFEQLVGAKIENSELLIYNLAKHLNRSVYRYRYGLVDTCTIDQKIQNDSKYLFKFVKKASYSLSKELNCPINDSEISLLTAYFGAHLRKNNLSVRKISVVLAVNQINSENLLLKKKVSDSFPMFRVKMIEVSQIFDYQESYSFLISTRLLKYNGLYVYISNQLTADDKKRIFDVYLRFRELKNLNIPEDLFMHIKQYIPRENCSLVQNELLKYFSTGISSNLSQLLKKENIQILLHPSDWRDALRKVSSPMIENGWIRMEYVNSMIANIELYGCYTYFEPGVYLAHAQSGKNVLRSGIAVSLINDGILFPEDKRVKLLIVIASSDRYEHFDVLREAVGICENPKNVERILECKNVNEMYLVLKKIANTEF